MNEEEHELSVLSEAETDEVTLIECNDKDLVVQGPDQPFATKKELICFFLFGVFNNFSFIIMLRYSRQLFTLLFVTKTLQCSKRYSAAR